MLIDKTDGLLDEVREFADSIGMREQLEKQLDYLDNYACHPEEDAVKTQVELTRDFAPHSFNFVILGRKTPNDEYRYWFNGGLIFHGSHDGFGSGAAPTLSVCLTPTSGWAVHT